MPEHLLDDSLLAALAEARPSRDASYQSADATQGAHLLARIVTAQGSDPAGSTVQARALAPRRRARRSLALLSVGAAVAVGGSTAYAISHVLTAPVAVHHGTPPPLPGLVGADDGSANPQGREVTLAEAQRLAGYHIVTVVGMPDIHLARVDFEPGKDSVTGAAERTGFVTLFYAGAGGQFSILEQPSTPGPLNVYIKKCLPGWCAPGSGPQVENIGGSEYLVARDDAGKIFMVMGKTTYGVELDMATPKLDTVAETIANGNLFAARAVEIIKHLA